MKLREKILYMSFGAGLVVLGVILNSLVSSDADAQQVGVTDATFGVITCKAIVIQGKDKRKAYFGLDGSGDREVSTTMSYVRFLTLLAKDKTIGKHVVPIVPDEARTFGMDPLFRQLGIYAHAGQLYDPVDSDQFLYYKDL